MKPYFCKYLPVEGEIKKGLPIAWWIGDKHGDVVIASEDGKWPKKYKVTKLFLCSRDNPDKIIGEVSQDAKWVKDGMEFSQEDIDIYDVSHLPVNVIHFKCPHCGTFM